jgi:hypothetical protein
VSREEKQTKTRTIRFPRPLETTQRSDALDFRLRRMHRFVDIILACVLVALAAGCSSPPANFYTLKGTVASPATTSSNLSVVVGPVSIPAMLDRPQMVLTTGPNQVAIDEFNRWAAPLQNIISRAVAENLTVMLGASLVTPFPDATSMDAAYRAVIDATFRIGVRRCGDARCRLAGKAHERWSVPNWAHDGARGDAGKKLCRVGGGPQSCSGTAQPGYRERSAGARPWGEVSMRECHVLNADEE